MYACFCSFCSLHLHRACDVVDIDGESVGIQVREQTSEVCRWIEINSLSSNQVKNGPSSSNACLSCQWPRRLLFALFYLFRDEQEQEQEREKA